MLTFWLFLHKKSCLISFKNFNFKKRHYVKKYLDNHAHCIYKLAKVLKTVGGSPPQLATHRPPFPSIILRFSSSVTTAYFLTLFLGRSLLTERIIILGFGMDFGRG